MNWFRFGEHPEVIDSWGFQSPYLLRWDVLRLFGFVVKFHVFMRSDNDVLHDHPARFISIGLAGRYVEVTSDGKLKEYRAPWIRTFPANYAHKLLIERPCLTLCIVFPKSRAWGFHCPNGWVSFKQFAQSGGCESNEIEKRD